MTRFATSPSRYAAIVAALMAVTSSTILAGPAAAEKYNRHTVSKKASFHTLQKHARSLEHAGVVKVTKIKRHGRVVGFKKEFVGSGNKVIVKRGRHGRVRTTTLKRKTFLQRWKQKLSFLKPRYSRHKSRHRVYNGFRYH